jgi:hypothetical protein
MPNTTETTPYIFGIPHMFAMAMRDDGWRWRFEIPWLKHNGMVASYRDRPVVSHEWCLGFARNKTYYWDSVATRKPQKTLGRRHEGRSYYRDRHPNARPMERQLNPDGAARRTGDWPFESLEILIEQLEYFRGGGQGLLCDPNTGEPLAVVANVVGIKEAHFPAYPPKLVKPFVLAGTSERGCCADCGAPWQRLVNRERCPPGQAPRPSWPASRRPTATRLIRTMAVRWATATPAAT